jgi:hypothetical protein
MVRALSIFMFCCSVAMAAVKSPTDQAAIVFVRDDLLGHKPVFGETVPQKTLQAILYLDEPCALPLVDTRGMHKYFSQWDVPQLGAACWFPTLDDGYTVIWRNGYSSHTEGTAFKYVFVKAMLHVDGSVTILRGISE